MQRIPYLNTSATQTLRDLDQLFGDAFENFGRLPGWLSARAGGPAVDLYEDDAHYYARLDLPGFSRDQVDIRVDRGTLTVSAATDEEDNAPQRKTSRSFNLPDGVAEDQIQARLEQGVLTLTLPKAETARPRNITVE